MIIEEPIICIICNNPINLKRLEAMPTTAYCVQCLQASGDVKKLKRHDDYIGKDGDEIVQTYFKTPNTYLKDYIENLMKGNIKGASVD